MQKTNQDELDKLQFEAYDFQYRLVKLDMELEHWEQSGLPAYKIKKLVNNKTTQFNRLIQIMEHCDALKQSDPIMYDQGLRGKETIRVCNQILDNVEKTRARYLPS